MFWNQIILIPLLLIKCSSSGLAELTENSSVPDGPYADSGLCQAVKEKYGLPMECKERMTEWPSITTL